jgi:uncharacterized protein
VICPRTPRFGHTRKSDSGLSLSPFGAKDRDMLFTPRHPPPWWTSLRVALWPRRSFGRSTRYLGWRIVRLGGSAHGLAIGVAIGVFVATLPILGLQFLLAGLLAWTLRGNVPAALLGTFWANPLSLPFLWLSSHWLGSMVLGTPANLHAHELMATLDQMRVTLLTPGKQTLSTVYSLLWPVWKPLLVGSVPIALVCAGLFYGLTFNLIGGYRTSRRAAPKPTPTELEVDTAQWVRGH